MIRRIRIAADSPLVDVVKAHGYKVEYKKEFDGSDDHSTVVAEFPFKHSPNAKLANEMSAIDQLEVIRRLNTEWSDNSVSCTVYFRPEELPQIREYLRENYSEGFKTLSFLLHSGHGFVQAPLEPISEETYRELIAATKPIVSVEAASFESDDECSSGACPVR